MKNIYEYNKLLIYHSLDQFKRLTVAYDELPGALWYLHGYFQKFTKMIELSPEEFIESFEDNFLYLMDSLHYQSDYFMFIDKEQLSNDLLSMEMIMKEVDRIIDDMQEDYYTLDDTF